MKPSQSILEPILNLECAAGHRYFSPTPSRWVGQTCRPYRLLEERCDRKLRHIPSSRKPKLVRSAARKATTS